MTTTKQPTEHSWEQELHSRFLSILPAIQLHAKIQFRHYRCPGEREDAIAEVTALSWHWFRRLALKGRDATEFPSALAGYAARAVRSGRRLCGQEPAKDVYSRVCRRRHGIDLSTLPDFSTLNGTPIEEALFENARTPVPDQVQFRLDFPRWRASLSERRRQMLDAMAEGARTTDLSEQFSISPARVSQLRRELKIAWDTFCEDTDQSCDSDRSEKQKRRAAASC